MCGIVAGVATEDIVPHLQSGLRRLEYRGYDSAGIAVATEAGLDCRRAVGKLDNLESRLKDTPLAGRTGIGHTRWATHGAPVEANAHPHCTERAALVHNGIIENYRSLHRELTAAERIFASETDTETVLHLVDAALAEGADPAQAVRAAVGRTRGRSAFVFAFRDSPDLLVAACSGSPLVIGYGENRTLIASDAIAFAALAQNIAYLEDGDIATITLEKTCIEDAAARPVERPARQSTQEHLILDLGAHRHYMIKEIHEQPNALGELLSRRIRADRSGMLPVDLPAGHDSGAAVDLIACGSAYYAALTAEYWIEKLSGLRARTEVASEFRYREPVDGENGLAVLVSQSGETADTLAAAQICRERGRPTLAVVNAPESSLERGAEAVLHIHAGPEIGVASTKAFTSQLAALLCLAAELAARRGSLSPERAAETATLLSDLPRQVTDAIACDEMIRPVAATVARASHVLYIGRGTMHPLALEGALKLKETSYLHAEGYPGGELKHGPIALIDETVVLVVLAPPGRLFEKTVSNMQEAIARGAQAILISDRNGIDEAGSGCAATIEMPDCPDLVAPIVYAPAVQLLAYHAAVLRGTDVDKPRNLAKSVTVE